jgi:asparagine synthetase B (glutamine-hydrolysing)
MYQHYYRFIRLDGSTFVESIPEAPNVKISKSGNQLRIDLPFPSIASIYYRFCDNGIKISTDLRLLHQNGDEIDRAGIASLLLLGFNVPPFSPFLEIRALQPGFTHVINLETKELKSEVLESLSHFINDGNGFSIDRQADILAEVLDRTIQELCPTQDPIVLFSGGVDSSLLASRISAMGWNRASYILCSFGDHDQETIIAKQISRELRIKLDVHSWNMNWGYESLDDAAKLFPTPYCDFSCVPTHSLTHAIESKYQENRIIFDGTGADSCFGLFNKVHKSKLLYFIPVPLRHILSSFYGPLQLWKSENSLEYYLRIIRRSSLFPGPIGSIAQNPLLKIGYYIDPNVVENIASSVNDWVSVIAESIKIIDILPLIGVGLSVPYTLAQKNWNPLLSKSFLPKYPFLEPKILNLAFTWYRYWPESTKSKAVLKHLLSKYVSSQYIYRKKAGFTPPFAEQFSHPVFLRHLRAVLDSNSPLSTIVDLSVTNMMLKEIESKRKLASQTYNFLWAITFCNTWLSQVDQISRDLQDNRSKSSSMVGVN